MDQCAEWIDVAGAVGVVVERGKKLFRFRGCAHSQS